MSKQRIGIVVGKFYPLHLGHLHLINTASEECSTVYIILITRPEEKISEEDRWNCLYHEMPDNALLLQTEDDIADTSEGWAVKTWNIILNTSLYWENQNNYDIAVYTSEDYGEPWAAAMGVEHRFVGREELPISGTEVREHPYDHFGWLPQATRNLLTFRVTVIGAESSGKTTLARELADKYDTVWAPEYGRFYTEGLPLPLNLTDTDFARIGMGQVAITRSMLDHARNGIIFEDTNGLVTAAWQQRYTGDYSGYLVHAKTDLYVLCHHDFDWVQDGTRESQEHQDSMFEFLLDQLVELGTPYIAVSGKTQERVSVVMSEIDYWKGEKNFV